VPALGELQPHWLSGNDNPFELAFVQRVQSRLDITMWGAVEGRIFFPTKEEYNREVGCVGFGLEYALQPMRNEFGEWFDAAKNK
jgi:hypothetical protein